MPDPAILKKVDKLSETIVFAEPTDLPGLADLHTQLQELAQWGEENGQPKVSSGMNAAVGAVETVILGEVEDPAAALDFVNRSVEAVQFIVRDGRDPDVVVFPDASGGAQDNGQPSEEGGAPPSSFPVFEADEKLLGDFVERELTVLQDVESLIVHLESGPDEEKFSELRRFLHTLKGEAAMLGLHDIERLCHTTEDVLSATPPHLVTDELLGVKDWLVQALGAIGGNEEAPLVSGMLERLARLRAAPAADALEPVPEPPPEEPSPEEVPPDEPAEAREPVMLDGDPELLGEFVTEAREHLENGDIHLLTLETTPDDEEALNAVFRAFHTIKGVAGFLALDDIQALAHEAENLLDRARKGELELSGAYVDISFETVDLLRRLVDHVSTSLTSAVPLATEPSQPALLARLRTAASGLTPPAPATQGAIDKPLGNILVEAGATSEAAVRGALEQQQKPAAPTGADTAAGAPPKPRLGELLVQSGQAKARDVSQALRAQKQRPGRVEVKEAVKVDADRLDRLIDLIGELVIAETMVSQSYRQQAEATAAVSRQLGQLDKITRELQEMGTSLRMVPVRATFQKMARLVRDVAKKSGKTVNFVTVGEDTELDKTVVDHIGDPLVHMVRNSVDHGIESEPQARVAAGKPETGRVELRAFHKGGSIYIELEDDGRGLNRDAILAKARDRGILGESDSLPDRDIWNLIFEPGFSTAQVVTDVSGRGVGMDVVRRNIETLHGQVEILNRPGEGCTFSIRLPLTLAIIDGMVVGVGTERYIVPTLSVVRTVRPESDQCFSVVKRGEMLSLQGELIPVFRLHRLFDIAEARQNATEALVVIVEDENRRAGFLVDELLGQQQIVIKSLGKSMRNMLGISGGAIMPDGRVGLILDVGGLVRMAHQDGVAGAERSTPEEVRQGAGL
jgi:two-component system, chemotaxis family, sensor kinase CheA